MELGGGAPASTQSASQADAALALLLGQEQTQASPSTQPLSFGHRFMKGLNDVSSGGAQLLTHSLPDKVVNAVNHATQKVNGLPVIGPITQALGMVPATAHDLDQQIKAGEQEYQARRGQNAGFDGARMLGNLAGNVPLMAVTPPGAGLGTSAAQGALSSALTTPATGDDGFWGEKAGQATSGAVGGAAGNLLGRAAGAVIAPKVSPAAKTLIDSGVLLTPGQIVGGAANRVEQAATSIPFLGDMIKNAQRRTMQSFDQAAVNQALKPVGEALPAGATGREAIEYATKTLGQKYGDALGGTKPLAVDDQFLSKLGSLHGLTGSLPKEADEQFGRILNSEIIGRVDQFNNLTPEAYKQAESQLGSLYRRYKAAPDVDKNQMSGAIKEAQATLQDLLQRQAPDTAAALGPINQGYANLLRVQRAGSYQGAEDGMFTPAQLSSAVRAMDSSKNKRAFATGNALMQDLSDAGREVLGTKVPDSGTPFRHAVQAGGAALLGHSMLPESAAAFMLPAAVGAGVASLPYTQMGQKLAQALLAKRPESAVPIGEALRGIAPYLAIPAAQAVTQGR